MCLINSDVLVTKNWTAPILNLFKKNDFIPVIQPKIKDYYKKNYFEYAGASGGFIDKYGYPFCRGRIFKTVEKNNGQYIDSKIFWASGACMFLQKKQFFELGGFDERFFAHMEEIDLCWRAFNSGIDCLASSNSIVYHIGAATIKEDSNKNYLNYRNSLIMLTKNLPLKSLLYVIFIRVIFDIISIMRSLSDNNGHILINIWNTHHKKYLPKHCNRLEPENINSGATLPGHYINLWRMEELYKVLIHELIHTFFGSLIKNSDPDH